MDSMGKALSEAMVAVSTNTFPICCSEATYVTFIPYRGLGSQKAPGSPMLTVIMLHHTNTRRGRDLLEAHVTVRSLSLCTQRLQRVVRTNLVCFYALGEQPKKSPQCGHTALSWNAKLGRSAQDTSMTDVDLPVLKFKSGKHEAHSWDTR